MIDERKLTDAECYKRANVDRRLFNKLKLGKNKPSKTTALALALGLGLDLDGTRELLGSAGFALTRATRLDVVAEYFITHKRYDVTEINEILFKLDEPLLGSFAIE